jgi:hypothetical protein
MTTIVLDDKSGATPIRDIVEQAKDGVIELRQPNGELVATLTLNRPPSPEEYAPFMAAAEENIEVLRQRAHSSLPGISTAELLSRLLTLTLREKT